MHIGCELKLYYNVTHLVIVSECRDFSVLPVVMKIMMMILFVDNLFTRNLSKFLVNKLSTKRTYRKLFSLFNTSYGVLIIRSTVEVDEPPNTTLTRLAETTAFSLRFRQHNTALCFSCIYYSSTIQIIVFAQSCIIYMCKY